MSLTGNTAKVHIIKSLEALFAAEPQKTFRVLDVGVTGPEPLNFWAPLFGHKNFELTGIDIDGPSIEALKAQTLPSQVKTLETLSGYDLAKRFGPNSFDVIISTQVLEHMRFPGKSIEAMRDVLAPGGQAFLCYDNGAYPRGKNHLKELLKDLVVRLSGSERYHDKDLPTAEVRRMLTSSGLVVKDERLYCVNPLKSIYGHETAKSEQDKLMDAWLKYEDVLNEVGHAKAHPERYLVAYFNATKS